MIENGAQVLALDKDLMTPLHTACRYGSTAVVRLLLSMGAAPDGTTDQRYQWRQLVMGWTDTVGRDDVRELAMKMWSPLHYACGHGDPVLAQLLLDAGANVEATESQLDQKEELKRAVEELRLHWDSHKVDEVWSDVRFASQWVGSPLCLAVQNGSKTLAAKTLLDRGAQVGTLMGRAELTPLHVACQVRPSAAMVNLLLDYGAAVDALDSWRCTPLHHACWHSGEQWTRGNNLEAATVLLQRGA